MAWIEPKTDWKIEYDAAGAFLGDFINYSDYNRIKNNVAYIISIAPQVVIDDYPTMGADKNAYTEYPRAGEWNAIENALHQLAANIGSNFVAAVFMENGFTPNYSELNRIESFSLRLKVQYETAAAMKFKMPFTLGQQSNDIRV